MHDMPYGIIWKKVQLCELSSELEFVIEK
jgi:hypothetical protein